MYGHSGTTVMAEWALNQLLLFYLSLYIFVSCMFASVFYWYTCA